MSATAKDTNQAETDTAPELKDKMEALSISKEKVASGKGKISEKKNPSKKKPSPTRAKKLLGRDPEQEILNAIQIACNDSFQLPEFREILQNIKSLFYNRDYDGVFGTPEHLPVYSAQYIPARALCYYTLFSKEPELLDILSKKSHLYCMGAGSGSELVGISAAMLHAPSEQQEITCHTQDIADWSAVLGDLETTIRKRWGLEENNLRCEFSMGSVLETTPQLEEQFQKADLITAMFVMNELFVTKKRAMDMISLLIKNMRKGSHLLIVDSAGSFSNLKVGERTYMIYMLFDALKNHFAPVISDNARWYRYPNHLSYPLDLNNMRFFVRLYQKL
ncbi:hypothetical protein K493DRAFT_341096 [Basidiobolus meristosporus CBS 931.73]|uniref:Uncharacterized protein n=1 Tax=Basidiobolus meristosporus CBS 931.73 TaxID=1314790 RepID=A0A1Y1XSL9_9FUNG|nr:hypothetical protein K493DRAFT_341096 [Basidiobolus meristosporus CBS 931.73]|eukprot:ORX88752.1 hypothetical protein K493DRAFT_341096 [Basidiobolus meristosporus CBS 931.73]